MMYKELARTGTLIPEIGIGTWHYYAGPEPLRRGMEAGATFIDTAESYGTETMVRDAIREIRDKVFVATKISPQNLSRCGVRGSTENSLRQLGVDRIDLQQVHEPNPRIPIEETMGAMAELVDEGKVRFVGVSNFSVAQLERARKACKYPVVSNQVRYNLIDRTIESGLLQYCRTNHVTVIAYCPLAREMQRIADCDPHGALDELARIAGKTPVQVILNWCVGHDGVVAIPKSNSAAHIIENCGASDWRLTPAQLRFVDGKIQYRQRNLFDHLVRQHVPHSVQHIAARALNALPRDLRRRLR
jgi:diketogulonate reductase-like aldo/keto reductase